MPQSNFQRFYHRIDFTALVGSLEENLVRIQTALNELTLVVPIRSVQLVSTGTAIQVNFDDLPTTADLAALDALVPTIVGGETTSAPIELNSFGAATTTSGTHQTKIEHTTDPLDAGTYQVLWTSSIRMLAVIANTGVEGKIRLDRSDGAFVEQTDAWDLANNHAYNGAITFTVAAGQTIHAKLSFARLGASGTAEMSGARVTIDKIN